MSGTTFQKRTADLTAIWRDNRWLYLLAGFTLGLLALPAAQMLNSETFDLLTGLVPEAVGITFTVLIVERLARTRAERDLKAQLIFELGSNEHTTAMRALRLLQHKGWLSNDELKGAVLREANLTNAKLDGVNLQEADLRSAKLERADLRSANLKGADLRSAKLARADLREINLEGANLWNANLEGSNLWCANLTMADMWRANLTGSYLKETNLEGANLASANFEKAELSYANLGQVNLTSANLEKANLWQVNLKEAMIARASFHESTILPDAQNMGDWFEPIHDKFWTPYTDMTRYTNPNHPDFWQPEWAKHQGTDDTEA
ncbi:MAG: pentapeptide repeat-containing protein [Chloroflexota bacterium]